MSDETFDLICFTKSGSLTNLKVYMGEGVGIEGWRLGVGGSITCTGVEN